MEIILQPWNWFFTGLGIAITATLITLNNKSFGVSSNLRSILCMTGVGRKISFFDFNWKTQIWNLVLVAGTMTGGMISSLFLGGNNAPNVSEKTLEDLNNLGFSNPTNALPTELFNLSDPTSIIILLVAGVLVGFGSRYAGGCTSGHAITGLSNLQLPSLIAVIGFFAGGLLMTFVLFPFIFGA